MVSISCSFDVVICYVSRKDHMEAIARVWDFAMPLARWFLLPRLR